MSAASLCASAPSSADGFTARALLADTVLDDRAIRDEELTRARHALAYLKTRIGNAAMRKLLADDLAQTTSQAREWVERSGGRCWAGHVELITPGPSAEAFHGWYERAMAERREEVMRAGNPEHFVLHLGDEGIEVIENIGESAPPWRVVYRTLPDDGLPLPWNDGYPVRFGAELVDGDGLLVGYTTHQARDFGDGLHLLLRTLLPEAAPASLVERHLRHFAIEFTNWTQTAWLEEKGGATS